MDESNSLPIHDRMTQVQNPLDQPVGPSLPGWSPPPHPARQPMAGRFCRVEPLEPVTHAASLHRENSLDPAGAMWTYLPYGPFQSPTMYRAWLAECARSDDPLFFAIVDSNTGDALGLAAYLHIVPESGSIEVGHLNFAPRLQRTPAATESMFLMMQTAFALGYRRYEWKCDALNAKSRSAAQRLGMSFEGVFRQATVYKGRSRDTAWYSALDKEWPALERAFKQWLDPTNFDPQGRQRVRLSGIRSASNPAKHT